MAMGTKTLLIVLAPFFQFHCGTLLYLRKHIQCAHEGVKYTCDKCDYQAKRKDYLAVHIKLDCVSGCQNLRK